MSTIPEPPSLKVFEHSLYVGGYLSAILYGVNITVYFLILQGLRSAKHQSTKSKKIFHAAFSTVMIVLLTIDTSVLAFWGEEMWIVQRDKPGGIPLFILTETSVWYQVMGTTCSNVGVLLGDAFLLYRLYVIFEASLVVVILPTFALLASVALTVIQLIIAVKSRSDFFHGRTVKIATSYYALNLANNIFFTLLIILRLRKMSRRVRDAIGDANARIYTSVSAMLIESAAPYALFGIAWVVPYIIGHPTAVGFGYVSGRLSCLSPLLIVLRVVNRTGWDNDTVSQSHPHPIQFRPMGRTRTTVISARNITISSTERINDASVTEEDKKDRSHNNMSVV